MRNVEKKFGKGNYLVNRSVCLLCLLSLAAWITVGVAELAPLLELDFDSLVVIVRAILAQLHKSPEFKIDHSIKQPIK